LVLLQYNMAFINYYLGIKNYIIINISKKIYICIYINYCISNILFFYSIFTEIIIINYYFNMTVQFFKKKYILLK